MDGTHMFLPKSSCQRSLWTTPRQISSLALLLLFEAYFLRYFHLWWYWQKVESFTCIMLDKTKRLFIFGMWFFFTLMYNLTRALFLLSNGNISPVHVVLVSLLVDQLFSLFLSFFGRPKKICSVSGNFWSGSYFFWSTKFLFGTPEFLFFWSTKKGEK